MKLYLINTENIYFSQIKEYFREIISSYDNGNYRSAMVMLYSTIVCDLLLKLKELSDVYSDSNAETILEEVEQQRRIANNSTWEWSLIKKIRDRTELLNDESYAILEHIYSLRNFSAHPALNEDYELISPTPEMTVAYIRKALDDILTKPSVFAQNIVDRMSDDVAAKKDLFGADHAAFKEYLYKVYFQRMSDKMMAQVFKAFWKFAFIKTDDELMDNNRIINRRTLRAILDERPVLICDYVKENKSNFKVAQDDSCLSNICLLLARCPQLYLSLDETVQYQIEHFDKKGIKQIAWFISGDIERHISSLIADNVPLRRDKMPLLKVICVDQGQPALFYKLVVHHFSNSSSYASTRDRFNDFIRPYLSDFDSTNIVTLIEAINSNPQIYNCFHQVTYNNLIMERAQNVLARDFDYSKYTHFEYTIVPESGVLESDEIITEVSSRSDDELWGFPS